MIWLWLRRRPEYRDLVALRAAQRARRQLAAATKSTKTTNPRRSA